MPKIKYPGMYWMAKELSLILNKPESTVYYRIIRNVKHLIGNIPPEELFQIFEEDEKDG